MKTARPVRGMNDILPDKTGTWSFIESTFCNVAENYGYEELRIPIVEYSDIFERSIGIETDIIEKEMYTFPDRGDDTLCLRPEGTAGCVRAAFQNGLITKGMLKRLWYMGPMFRYERPQMGRQRQFHQAGLEVFGIETPDVDLELLLFCNRIWKELNITSLVKLKINTIGDVGSRTNYVRSLVSYLEKYIEDLDNDSRKRLKKNPLRILDSKDQKTQEILSSAPDFKQFVDKESREHFEKLCELLEFSNIEYEVNSTLVRGLDYYNRTVFEWVTQHLGAQGTICGGGRYDGLVYQIFGKHSPAVGCAFGLDRLVLLIDEIQTDKLLTRQPDLYIVAVGEAAEKFSVSCAEKVRNKIQSWQVLQNVGGGSIRTQMKRANKSGAKYAIIIGEDEVEKECVTLKFLTEDLEQELLSKEYFLSRLEELSKTD